MAEKVFNKPDTAPYLSLTAIALVLAALVPVNRSSLRSLGLIRTFALLYTMPHATTLVLLGALTFTAQTQDAPVYAVLGGSMLTGIAGLLIVEAYFRSNMDRNSAVEHLQPAQILNLSVPILLSSVFMMVIAQAGVIISGVFLTEAEVGYLAIAAKLAGLTAFVLTAINAVMAPRFSKLHHAGKIQELLDEASRSARLIFVAAAPILLTLVIGGNAIIGFFFGPEFQQAYGALLILMIGQTINAACGSTGIFMNMTGHQKELRNAVALAACISIGLHFALIPTMGIYGAAIATAAGIAIWNISAMLFIRKSFGRSIGYFPLLSKWRSS